MVCNWAQTFNPTSEDKWQIALKTLKPEYVSNDEGYIYFIDRIKNIAFCCTKNFGWMAFPIGYVDNPNWLLLKKIIKTETRQLIPLCNPIRFRYTYDVNNNAVITKVMVEELEGFKTAPSKPQFTREQVIQERNNKFKN